MAGRIGEWTMTLYRTVDPKIIVALNERMETVEAVGTTDLPHHDLPLIHLAVTESGHSFVQRLRSRPTAWVTPLVVLHVMMNIMETSTAPVNVLRRFHHIFASTPDKADDAIRSVIFA